MVKNFFWNVCWFCASAAGLLVWTPRNSPAAHHLAHTLEDAWTIQRTNV